LKEQEEIRVKSSITEKALKVVANSAYGCCGTPYFRFYRTEIAEAITLTGQLTIQCVINALNEFLNDLLHMKNHDFCAASDTDSCYICLDKLVEKIFPNGAETSKIVDFLDKACNDINKRVIEKVISDLGDYINLHRKALSFKREVISDKSVFVCKKKYIMNVLDSEGVRYAEPKLKVMGIETVRSSTPQIVRDELKRAIKLIMSTDEDTIIRLIADFRQRFNTCSPEEVAFPRSVNGLDKYSDKNSIYGLKTPIHVKGALIYNHLIHKYHLENKYEMIMEGNKVKFLYLKVPNPTGDKVIAFPGKLPKEFKCHDFVDYEKQFESSFLSPLKTILDTIGWKTEHVATLESFFG
jgi:DNA polymerase elongation subunit (family B)